ncbi:hypothetical protein [Streptomyces sp. NPDC093600]|uniref:hypothetical protein n=1 Tax=Streptomyces sp. NPDC093600 TaxID=3366047 RepID=UPI00381321DE
MSQEAPPERAMHDQPVQQSVPEQKGAGAPKGLLQQMEELMAALTADLSQLDADLQSSPGRQETEQTQRAQETQESRESDRHADAPGVLRGGPGGLSA